MKMCIVCGELADGKHLPACPNSPETFRINWDYLIGRSLSDEEVAQHGREGWELVSVVTITEDRRSGHTDYQVHIPTFYFKRKR